MTTVEVLGLLVGGGAGLKLAEVGIRALIGALAARKSSGNSTKPPAPMTSVTVQAVAPLQPAGGVPYEPGQTGRFEIPVCARHEDMKVAVGDSKAVATQALAAANLASAAATAAQAAAVSSKECVDAAIETLTNMREWKGGVDARLATLEREMGTVRRGGSAAR